MKKSSLAIDSTLILVLAALLVWPLFRIEYLNQWPSIESTFISDARMLAENLPHPGWQPLWYTGTRFDYIYPPALRYGTALISKAGGVSTARAYHLYIGSMYILGILGVYWLVVSGTRSRFGGWLAAALTALISPCFLFLKDLRWDSAFGSPQRLHVLVTYGEGPHISALCVLPAALAASWMALRARRPAFIGLAAVLSALVVSNNFYGATSLALIFPVMVWSAWVSERSWRVPARASAIAALAYGICAFWLTPGYIGVTIENLRMVADPGDRKSVIIFSAIVAILGVISFRLGNRRPERAWPIFAGCAAGIISLYVLGHHYLGLQVAGNSVRLAPELDAFLIVAFATAAVCALKMPRWRVATGMVVLLAFLPAQRYLRHLWSEMPESKSIENVYPREITKWLTNNLVAERVLSTGQVRFWFNAWGNVAQPDGGSQQGVLNQLLPVAFWQIWTGEKLEPSVLWLQALGTDAIVVADKNSRDSYRGDIQFPGKFIGLKILHDDGHGTVTYRIPRTYPGTGRVVDAKVLANAGRIAGGLDTDQLTRYTAETEKAGRAAVAVNWKNFDEVRLQATSGPGESLLLQQTYDSSWFAEENGKRLEIRRDPGMGFMLVSVAPGVHDIWLRFETPRENRIGQILSLLSLFVVGALVWLEKR